jgi:hypothetical protein
MVWRGFYLRDSPVTARVSANLISRTHWYIRTFLLQLRIYPWSCVAWNREPNTGRSQALFSTPTYFGKTGRRHLTKFLQYSISYQHYCVCCHDRFGEILAPCSPQVITPARRDLLPVVVKREWRLRFVWPKSPVQSLAGSGYLFDTEVPSSSPKGLLNYFQHTP